MPIFPLNNCGRSGPLTQCKLRQQGCVDCSTLNGVTTTCAISHGSLCLYDRKTPPVADTFQHRYLAVWVLNVALRKHTAANLHIQKYSLKPTEFFGIDSASEIVISACHICAIQVQKQYIHGTYRQFLQYVTYLSSPNRHTAC